MLGERRSGSQGTSCVAQPFDLGQTIKIFWISEKSKGVIFHTRHSSDHTPPWGKWEESRFELDLCRNIQAGHPGSSSRRFGFQCGHVKRDQVGRYLGCFPEKGLKQFLWGSESLVIKKQTWPLPSFSFAM